MYDFLLGLVINSNWHPISYRFRVIAAYCSNFGHFASSSHPLLGLGTTYDVHLGFIGNCVVDFVLVLIELFSLGVTAEEIRAYIGWKSAISLQRGSVDPKFQVERVALTKNSSSQETRLIKSNQIRFISGNMAHKSYELVQKQRQTEKERNKNIQHATHSTY